ncbi:MAG: hypothetical protein H0W07_04690 [Chloroflexi bacterium]|nr:hypothetical protein [Chloroflexota bacterium]
MSFDDLGRPSAWTSAAIYTGIGTIGPAAVLFRLGAAPTTIAIATAFLATAQFLRMRSLLSGWIQYRRAGLMLASQWIVGAIGGGALTVAGNVRADQSAWVALAALVFVVGLVGLARPLLDVPEPRLAVVALAIEIALAIGLVWLSERVLWRSRRPDSSRRAVMPRVPGT